MSAARDEALEVMRAVWRGQGQAAEAVADDGDIKSCKRMADVGFDEFGEGTAELRQAWRDRLAREGKLSPAGGSVRDLVLGEAEHETASR
jgi:hypothetical protein